LLPSVSADGDEAGRLFLIECGLFG
jgi:hypothetical protein